MLFRWVAIFFLTASLDAFAITKETATTRCEVDIKLLKQARMSFSDDQVDGVFQKIIAFLEATLTSLKKTHDISEIATFRQQCNRGFQIARFFSEVFGGKRLASDDVESVPTNTTSIASSSMPPVITQKTEDTTDRNPKKAQSHE